MDKTEPSPTETSKNSIWDILNAPFVLFVMTSMVLGGISFAYQEYSTYRKEITDRDTQIAHLRAELEYRIDVISAMVQPLFTYTVLFTAHGPLLGAFGNRTPDDVLAGEYSPIYPEFSQRNITSLLWELQDLERKTAKDFSLVKSIDTARRMRP
jgi:hypothetical protein